MKISPRKKFLPLVRPLLGNEEKREIIDTLNSGWITLGPKTQKFETDLASYLEVKYVIALNSCSAALHLALLAIDLQPGDEVITTTFTFAATSHAISHCGAKPVLVDIDPKTFNIDPKKVEAAITKKTKAILPVHYGGQPVDLTALKKIAKKYNLYLIEDAAFAVGAKYKNNFIGTIGDMTCFSFHPVKSMTTSDGGAISTNNKKLAEKIMVLRVNGMDKESWKRYSSSGSWDYSITMEGYKYHMTDIQASLGIHQLKKLNGFLKKRKQLSENYNQQFKGVAEITLPPIDQNSQPTHNLYPILIDINKLSITRNEVMELLKKYNIGSNVFFRPLHMQPFFQQKYGYKKGDMPESEYVFERLICLPLFPGMTFQDVKYVGSVLKEIINSNKKIT